jgi:hypothetical protein|tara:strand:+ start:1651 stop:2283 length:633 start_codon:yes stop_codon:yes gene_type:complete
MTNTFVQNFNNYGILTRQFTSEELLPVQNEIEKIKNNFESSISMNSSLIGNIEKEYRLLDSKDHLENLIMPLVREYDNTYNYLSRSVVLLQDVPLRLTNAWVNFQSKNEFNPNHDHDGIFSFVIWTHVPYNMNTEKDSAPGKYSKNNLAGAFEFQYTNILGDIQSHTIHIDKSVENTIVLFPAKLRHCVYPFYTSNDYRISVSGNFMLTL